MPSICSFSGPNLPTVLPLVFKFPLFGVQGSSVLYQWRPGAGIQISRASGGLLVSASSVLGDGGWLWHGEGWEPGASGEP